jgi:hypothetical protein
MRVSTLPCHTLLHYCGFFTPLNTNSAQYIPPLSKTSSNLFRWHSYGALWNMQFNVGNMRLVSTIRSLFIHCCASCFTAVATCFSSCPWFFLVYRQRLSNDSDLQIPIYLPISRISNVASTIDPRPDFHSSIHPSFQSDICKEHYRNHTSHNTDDYASPNVFCCHLEIWPIGRIWAR